MAHGRLVSERICPLLNLFNQIYFVTYVDLCLTSLTTNWRRHFVNCIIRIKSEDDALCIFNAQLDKVIEVIVSIKHQRCFIESAYVNQDILSEETS